MKIKIKKLNGSLSIFVMNRKLFNSNDRYKNLAEILIESFLIIGKEEVHSSSSESSQNS